MAVYRNFRSRLRIGPVEVGTYRDARGREMHAAACTAPRCGFSADYHDRSAAELAARTHRCKA
ncbi:MULTISPECIES: mobile element transfer protein [Streptomyces violaceoruber group]|uniref:mobile element transfer protein n=1 Tax=Streptomyces violaceoruber group TaxID=2867121 RepID=UPI0004CB4D08|nr:MULTISPECIES: mobile element transfer protein [Streptomyces anthocyanicus group]WSB62404.1 Mobile element transfer [Streptomyces anthocyanicus]